MTKILMTSVRDDEHSAIKAFAKEHGIEIITPQVNRRCRRLNGRCRWPGDPAT